MSFFLCAIFFIQFFFLFNNSDLKELKPLWIYNTYQAAKSGVDVSRIAREYCKAEKPTREVEFLSADNVEPIFGLEIAEDLLREYSYVAINISSLCQQIKLSGAQPKFSINGQNEFAFLDEKDTTLSKELGKKVEVDKPVEIEEESNDKKGSKKEKDAPGPIGIDVQSFDSKSINSLEKALRGENDTEVDEILARIRLMSQMDQKPFASTLIIPIMKRSKYDPRLAHGLKAPILVTEESFLKSILLTPSSTELPISTFTCSYFQKEKYLWKPVAFPNNIIKFSWFSKKEDAININKNVQLPELYIDGADKSRCASVPDIERSMLACLLKKPKFYFVSIKESNAAKETLPKVSYVKAIDIWFGFTATFVFCTMFQALVVITLEHLSKIKKKVVEEQNESLSVHKVTRLLVDSKRYHNWARGLDDFFKVMYPVIFIIFLFVYVFVIIEGDENKCLRGNQMGHSVSSSEL